jgi:hypothetical protein
MGQNNTKNLIHEMNKLDLEDEEYILEGKCGDKVEIPDEKRKELMEKAKKSTCIINSKINGKYIIGTGFFCEIPFKNKKMKVLFTNNHVLNEESIQIGKTIKIIYQGKAKDIEISEDRFCLTDSRDYKEGLDYTCIQIFEKDGIEDFYEYYEDKINFKDEIVSISGYPNGKELTVETGHIKYIKSDYKIYHTVDTDHGVSGAPIILTYRDFKVIGIHRCNIKEKEKNLGSYIKYIVKNIQNEKIVIEL